MIKGKIATGFPHKSSVSTPNQEALARGIDHGLRVWLKSFTLRVQGVGFAGSGVASGLYVVPYNVGLMELGLRAGGIGGFLLTDLSVALTRGVSGEYRLNGVSRLVGSGNFTGNGQGMGSEAILYESLKSSLLREGIVGSFDLSRGVSKGVINLMRSGIVTQGLIQGAVSTSPSSGLVTLSIGV